MSLLPKLAFGNHVTLASVEALKINLESINLLRPIHLPDPPKHFQGCMTSAQLGSLTLSAFTHTPVTVSAAEAPGHAVIIPCHGHLTFTTNKERFTTHAGQHIALLAGEANTVATSLDSHVLAPFDPERLQRTAQSMLGLCYEQTIDLDLRIRAVSNNPSGLPLGEIFNTLFQHIDHMPSANLALLGLDDIFYRTLAAILSPQVAAALVAPEAKRQPLSIKQEIKATCDYIQAHLEHPISLSELEQVSGLSARSLQLAFQKHFQCTPTQWIRQARLELARQRLLQALPGITVSMIALDCGFTQLGMFAKAYQKRYGELPSETLRKQHS